LFSYFLRSVKRTGCWRSSMSKNDRQKPGRKSTRLLTSGVRFLLPRTITRTGWPSTCVPPFTLHPSTQSSDVRPLPRRRRAEPTGRPTGHAWRGAGPVRDRGGIPIGVPPADMPNPCHNGGCQVTVAGAE
jgi:hypothetical protein